MGEHDEQIVFEMGYNAGFKNGIKGSIPKADYENRIKADMAAMLTEIQLEIEELYPEHQCSGELTGFADAIETITPIIQQKINALKEVVNMGVDNENVN